MTEPRWLTVAMVEDMHAEQLAIFGGPDGMRDRGLLESAVARPQHEWAYEEGDLPELAAAYAFGIARNHRFRRRQQAGRLRGDDGVPAA